MRISFKGYVARATCTTQQQFNAIVNEFAISIEEIAQQISTTPEIVAQHLALKYLRPIKITYKHTHSTFVLRDTFLEHYLRYYPQEDKFLRWKYPPQKGHSFYNNYKLHHHPVSRRLSKYVAILLAPDNSLYKFGPLMHDTTTRQALEYVSQHDQFGASGRKEITVNFSDIEIATLLRYLPRHHHSFLRRKLLCLLSIASPYNKNKLIWEVL